MSDPIEDLASTLGVPASPTPVPSTGAPAVFPATVTAVASDGTVTATMNGAAVTATGSATATPNVGDVVFILTYNNANSIVGIVSTTQNVGNGFVPGDRIETFSTATSRPGWLKEDGTSYSTTTYAALFAVIGHTYGGSGATFKVPDSRNLLSIGAGSTYTIGTNAGAATVALSVANLASHSHANTAAAASVVTDPTHSHNIAGGTTAATGSVKEVPGNSAGALSAAQSTGVTVATTVTMTNASTGSGTAFSIIPPVMPVNRWIKT